MPENVSILHYALGNNVSQLRFGRIFCHVLVAFWSRFGRVLVANITKMQTQHRVYYGLNSSKIYILFYSNIA